MESDIYDTVLEATDGAGTGWYLPYPLAFQVPLASVLLLEIVLGASSNLAVLALYGLLPGLVDSLSNVVTMNLHVLDALTCMACAPLTVSVVLLPLGRNVALLCCFHEACVTFSSVASTGNLLAISLDRYDMSVRPARRVLTPGRMALLLAGVWLLALLGFFLPFVEMEFLRGPGPAARQNRTVLCVSVATYHAELGLYSHLLLQVPAFFVTAAAMLVAYARILRALHRDVGSRVWRGRSQRRKRKKCSAPGTGPGEAPRLSQAAPPCPRPMRVQASVSVIVALRRALKRHRARRQRQKRVFRMSLTIVCTFLVCWAPISVANLLVLVELRLACLAMAYGTTVFHPLLYALARQKLCAALRGRVKKRVVSVLQVEPSPGGSVIHKSWVQPPEAFCAWPAGHRLRGSSGPQHTRVACPAPAPKARLPPFWGARGMLPAQAGGAATWQHGGSRPPPGIRPRPSRAPGGCRNWAELTDSDAATPALAQSSPWHRERPVQPPTAGPWACHAG